MTALAVIGGVAVAGIAVAALYDYRARRRGARVDMSRVQTAKRQRWSRR